jgi:two-component system CheB/CheR fusion protein
LLYYALNPEGILFLGSAETIGEFNDLFRSLNNKWRIYKRKAINSRKIVDYPAALDLSYKPDRPDDAAKRYKKTDLHALSEKTVLEQFAPAAVLIEDKYEILHFVGRTEKFFVPPTGKPSFNLLSMARADLKYDLTAALHQAVREKKPASRKGIRIRYNGGSSVVDLSISPFASKDLSMKKAWSPRRI